MVNPISTSPGESKDGVTKSPNEPGANMVQRRFLGSFRKKSSKIKSPNTVETNLDEPETPQHTPLINISIGEDIELMTPESKERMDERIRRNLFPDFEDTADTPAETPSRVATSMSVEVTPDGKFIESNDSNSVGGADASPNPFSAPDSQSPVHNLLTEEQLTFRKTTYRGPVSVDSPERSEDESTESFPETAGIKVAESTIQEDNPMDSIFEKLQETPFRDAVGNEDDLSGLGTFDDAFFVEDNPSKQTEENFDPIQEHLARQLLGAFCADDGDFGSRTNFRQKIREISLSKNPVRRLIDLFYDNTCSATNIAETNRPYFDQDFTLRFIRRMTTKGAALLHLQAPGSIGNKTNDWKGRTVAMLLEKGSPNPNEKKSVQPRITWTTVLGGQNLDAITTSIDLFDIVSIKSSSKDELLANQGLDEDRDEFCFFTITVSNGQVYVFESNNLEERDSLVSGLRNVISRLAFQVTVGDVSALKELYLEEDAVTLNTAVTGDLPALPNPMQAINRVAHAMLG